MDREQFSNLLVSIREGGGFSKADMCHKMDFLSYRPLIRIERAEHNYGIGIAIKYLSVLNKKLTLYDGQKRPINIREQLDFHKFFMKEIKKRNLAYIPMAKFLNVSKGLVQNLCENKTEISIDKFLQIVEKLGYKVIIAEK